MNVKLLLLPLVLTACLAPPTHIAFGQKQKEHVKKTFVDDQQRLYLQASLPVYLFASTSSDGKNAIRLNSEETKEHANPMHFDGPGKHYLRHKDVHEHVEVTFEIYADAEAPKTTLSHENDRIFKAGGKTYSGKDLQITLKAKDDMSGVENIFYSINQGEYQTYNNPITLDQEKEYALSYYAVDNVGNAENPSSATFVVAKKAPISKLEIDGEQHKDVLSPRSTIKLSSSDEISGVHKIYYKIDDGPEKIYTAPVKISSLSEGEHTITYYAANNVLNKEEAKSYVFFLDKSAPLLTADVMGDSFIANGKEFFSGRSKLKLTAVDNKAGVDLIYYSVNGGEFKVYEAPFYLESSKAGLAVAYFAVDKVGNKSNNKIKGDGLSTTYMDLTGPNLSYAYQGPVFRTRDTTFISPKTKIILKGSDVESGIQKLSYSHNKKGETDYTEPFSIDQEGLHFIDYFGYDNVNNKNSSSFHLFVDKSGPEIFHQLSILPIGKKNVNGKELNVYSEHVVLFISATDAKVGFEKMFYSINGGPEKLWLGPIKEFQKGKDYTVKVRALDKLGNELISEFAFAIEG
jgi:hypothetical protein